MEEVSVGSEKTLHLVIWWDSDGHLLNKVTEATPVKTVVI